MAHRIEQHDRHEGIQQAWHGLTVVRPELTLDNNWLRTWDVTPVVLDKRGEPTKWRILEATDKPGLEVGTAYNSETYQPITNAQFLALVEKSIAGTDHKVVSVGSTRNRGRVFLSVELQGKEKFEAAGRKFSAFLNFGNGHDKSSVLWVNTSNICTVCDNTFTFNLFSVETQPNRRASRSTADDLAVRVFHKPGVEIKLPALADLIDRAVGVQAEFAQAMNLAAAVKCDTTQARELFAGFVGRELKAANGDRLSKQASKQVGRLVELFETGRGNDGDDMSDAFSAVTDYFTHESSRGDDKARQFLSSEFEAGLRAKREFWSIVQNHDMRSTVRAHGAALLSV